MPPKRSLRLRTDEERAKEAAITPGKRDRRSSESSTSLSGSPSKKQPAAKKLMVEEEKNTASQEEEMVTPSREVEEREPDSSKCLARRLAGQNQDDTIPDSPSVLDYASSIATPDAVSFASK